MGLRLFWQIKAKNLGLKSIKYPHDQFIHTFNINENDQSRQTYTISEIFEMGKGHRPLQTYPNRIQVFD